MYKPRLKGSHKEMGKHYGCLLYKNGVDLNSVMPTKLEQIEMGKKSLSICESIYPEIIDEIKAMATELHIEYEVFGTFIITAGAFSKDIGCTTFCYKKDEKVYFCRNHDMFSDLKKVTETALVRPDDGYYFLGQGDGLIGKEDGINEHGLAVGMNFVAPKVVKPGLNFFIIIRMLLEKCKSVTEAIELLKKTAVCTSHNITVADKSGNMAVIEMCPDRIAFRYPEDDNNYIIATNQFISEEMKEFDNKPDYDWYSTNTRYRIVKENLSSYDEKDPALFKEILSGKRGMMCQYKKDLNFETLWSVIFELSDLTIERVDGNPSRKKFKVDNRLDWGISKRKQQQ